MKFMFWFWFFMFALCIFFWGFMIGDVKEIILKTSAREFRNYLIATMAAALGCGILMFLETKR